MPRTKRLTLPGAIYHVIGRGIERMKIFLNDKDRDDFLGRLEKGLGNTGAQCLAWALLPNHYHLLIRISSYPLSRLMGSILTGYAVNFNGGIEELPMFFKTGSNRSFARKKNIFSN